MPSSQAVQANYDSSPKTSNGDQARLSGSSGLVDCQVESSHSLPRGSDPAGKLPIGHGSENKETDGSTNPEQKILGSRPVCSRSRRDASPTAERSTEYILNESPVPSRMVIQEKTGGGTGEDPDTLTYNGHDEKHTVKPSSGEPISVLEDGANVTSGGVSGWSHQALAPHNPEVEEHKQEDEWQDMPAFAPYDIYNDDGKLVAREERASDGEGNAYEGLGGAGKGYTRVQVDEDALSATSMDDNTNYLFKAPNTDEAIQDEELRDASAQLQATKDLLTEGQRIAYVGVARLALAQMMKELEDVEITKGTKNEAKMAVESVQMWSQTMMLRLYAHMEINTSGGPPSSRTNRAG